MKRVVALADLWDGDMAGFVVDGAKVLIVRVDGAVHAYEDRCAHLGVPLSEGELDGRVVRCRAHHYEYDACTGCGLNPATVTLRAFPVAIRDGAIWVELSPAGDDPA